MNCRYKKFSKQIVTLMIAETNNEFLIKSHNARPTGTKSFHEVNTTNTTNVKKIQSEKIKPIGVMVINSKRDVGDPIIHMAWGHINGFNLDNIPKGNNPRKYHPKT